MHTYRNVATLIKAPVLENFSLTTIRGITSYFSYFLSFSILLESFQHMDNLLQFTKAKRVELENVAEVTWQRENFFLCF